MFVRISKDKGGTEVLKNVSKYRVHKEYSELHVVFSDGDQDIISGIVFAEKIEFDATGKK